MRYEGLIQIRGWAERRLQREARRFCPIKIKMSLKLFFRRESEFATQRTVELEESPRGIQSSPQLKSMGLTYSCPLVSVGLL